jgi:hypothetical protein
MISISILFQKKKHRIQGATEDNREISRESCVFKELQN